MPSFSEEEFQAHISFEETTFDDAPPANEPNTSPPAPYGSLNDAGAGALGGRSYRMIAMRVSPLPNPAAAAAGIYFLETDYDVAMADLDHSVNDASAGASLRIGDLIRVGSLASADGRVRGVYRLRLTNTGGVGAGTPSDEPDSLVTVTMKRVNPNIGAP